MPRDGSVLTCCQGVCEGAGLLPLAKAGLGDCLDHKRKARGFVETRRFRCRVRGALPTGGCFDPHAIHKPGHVKTSDREPVSEP